MNTIKNSMKSLAVLAFRLLMSKYSETELTVDLELTLPPRVEIKVWHFKSKPQF